MNTPRIKALWKNLFSSDLRRYFLYFCGISLFITLLLTICTKSYVSNILKKQAIESNEDSLVQLSNAQDTIMAEIEKSLTNVIFDPDFADFSNSYSTIEKFNLNEKLQRVTFSNKNLEDIAIFYPSNAAVLSATNGIYDLSSYYDSDFLNELLSQASRYNHTEARLKYDPETRKDVSVISIIKTIPINISTSGLPSAILIADINASSLQRIVDSIKISNASSVVMTTYSGNVIAGSKHLSNPDFSQFYTEDSDTALLKSFTGEVSGAEMLISQLYSERYKWMYFYLTPTSVLNKKLNTLNLFLFLLCLILVFFSVVGSYILAKRLYNPILKIAQRFFDTETETDHIALIDKNVDTLITANKNLNELLFDYNLHLKNEYVTGLLAGEYKDMDSVSSSLEYYDINFDVNGSFVVFALSIDTAHSSEKNHSKKQKDTFMIYMSGLIENEVLQDYNGFVFAKSENMYIIILNFASDKDFETIPKIAYEAANKTSVLLSESLKYPFTIGVSNISRGISNLQVCYNEAMYALNYKLISGYNNIILYESVNSPDRVVQYPYNIEKNIATALKAVDKQQLKSEFDAFVAYVIDNTLNTDVIRQFFLQLFAATSRCMYDMNITFEDIGLSQDELYKKLLNAQKAKEFPLCIEELHEAVLNHEILKRESKNKDILAAVNEYIRSNLSADLSTAKLAGIFFLSPSYLRKIYKEENSITLKQFIDDERIRYAKELLENSSDIKINDIPEKIGYLSSQAFTRSFKNHTGMTPREYRAKVLRRESISSEEE